MEINKVKIVCFSPTGTTRKILVSIAKGFGADVIEAVNLTPSGGEWSLRPLGGDELAIIGVPVYGGRVPAEAIKRLHTLKANRSPAVLVVVYGNRDFEDALLELKNLAIELGCVPVAAGAFVGEHSFSTNDRPIAAGRPDAVDLQKAEAFGLAVRETLSRRGVPAASGALAIPGRFPYEGGARAMSVAPVTNEDRCALCGVCAEVCPTAAIVVGERVETSVELCIRCCACIKSCPEEARGWEDPMMLKITQWLHENCGQRKEPQLFGLG